MALSFDVTEDDLFIVLRSFCLAVIPTGTEVIRAQVNRVPEPKSANFVIMNSAVRQRLSTGTVLWDPADPAPANLRYTSPAQVKIQCDVHGPLGADIAWMIVTLLRSGFGCDFFTAGPMGGRIQPLYVDDPKQVPFINASQQYEDRWAVDVQLQVNPTVQVPQQYADALDIETQIANAGPITP